MTLEDFSDGEDVLPKTSCGKSEIILVRKTQEDKLKEKELVSRLVSVLKSGEHSKEEDEEEEF